ncbi:MAG: HD family phosphohydrolase [bacterium]
MKFLRRNLKRKERIAGSKFPLLLPLIFAIIISSFILVFPFSFRSYSLRIGKTAPFDIRAFRTVQYINVKKTEALRREAEGRVAPQYVALNFANIEAEDSLRECFRLIREAKLRRITSPDALKSFRSSLPIPISLSSLTALIQSKENLALLEDRALQILRLVMQTNIRDAEEELRMARERAHSLVLRTLLPSKETMAIAELVSGAVRPNLVVDENATRKLREKARNSVKPVYERIMFGELIVRKGEKITPEIYDRLLALGVVGRLPPLKDIASIFLAVALSYSIILLFLSHYKREIYENLKLQSLLWLLLILAFLGFKLGISFQFTPAIVSAALCIAVASLLGGETSAIVLPFSSFLMSLSAGGEMEIGAMGVLAGGVGIVSTLRLRERIDLLKSSLALAGTILLSTFLLVGWGGEWMSLSLFWGIISAILGIVIAWLGVSIFERLFGITTHFQLLELANPDKPLLRELLINAPGSYQHSIITANLAEAAAKAIGADALLCRVSALYHDIGKMKRPLYFIENQLAENIHENLTPSLSSLVIISHVRDGVEMAKKAKLPPKVIEIIAQHHGTSLVSYFYHRALGEKPEEVEEEKYRYDGPKPQSKEAAIVMLADSVEAAVRSLPEKTPANVEMLVERIINQKLADGQLDEADISLKDLRKIKSAFLSILTALIHKRLEYPAEEEMKVGGQNNRPKQNEIKEATTQKDSQSSA